MRRLPLTFLLLSLGPLSACGSTVVSGTGGGHSSSSSSSSGTGSSSGGTETCYTLYDQCLCDGVPVGPRNGCNVGEACGLDAGLPDGGACECKELSEPMTCD